jgi:MerR family copper efflux transcriptional regulator
LFVVVNGYRIQEVADRSGFTAATLRYYEEIGILPASARTPSGYRTYDDTTLARLAFISRAKQLGCTLDEISDLTTAWDGGQCGPVQDRLRVLVADKVTAAQAQIAELMTFTNELQNAAAALERHRPDGACDGDCGCFSNAADVPVVQTVSLTSKPDVAIACTLSAGSMKGRMFDWQNLLSHVVRREGIDGGVRCVFGADVPTGDLIRLVAAEQDCCQFFRFAITVDARGVALEGVAPPDALPFLTAIFGEPS